MPNRPICAEDALLSETPMPPEQILCCFSKRMRKLVIKNEKSVL